MGGREEGMRFSLALPADRVDAPDEFLSAEAVGEIAATAERHGFDAVFLTEHPVPEDAWLARGGHHALDPFVALAFAAAATRRLRLQTHLVVLPYRNPYLLAKSVASLDVLSGGRVILGAGAGYLEAEFRALGADFSRRNRLADETLEALERAWSGESFEIEGADGATTRHTVLPRPLQRPGPPVWMGGNSRTAIRRAVERCAGWLPFPNPPQLARVTRTAVLANLADLRARIGFARAHAERVGRSAPLDVAFSPFTPGHYGQPGFEPAALLDEIGELEALGVTWLTTLFATTGRRGVDTRARYLELIEGFAADVIRSAG